jgi:hypothetical protein
MKPEYILIFFLLISSVLVKADSSRTFTKSDALSTEAFEEITGKKGQLLQTYSYDSGNKLIGVYRTGSVRLPQDLLLLWQRTPSGYVFVHQQETMPGNTYEKPVLFSIHDFEFLKIATAPSGSAGFVTYTMLWLAPDRTAHEVDFQEASEVFEGLVGEDEIVLTGGEREFFYDENEMKFQFWIAQAGDPHCCPSRGEVTGTYKLVGSPNFDNFARKYSPNFQIQIDQLERSAPADIQ